MRPTHVISAAVLIGAACLSITACDPITFQTADGGHGTVSCPDAPTATPTKATAANCSVAYTPGSTTTAPVTTTTPVAPPTTTAPVTTTSPPVSSPPPSSPAGQFPNAGNTGVPAGTALATQSGDVHLGAGGVLRDAHVTGSVYIEGNGAVIEDSEVDGGINNATNGADHYSFTVTDTTIGPASGCKDAGPEAGLEAGNFTATRVQIRNYNHSVQPEAADAVVTDSFMKVCANPGDHADGVIAYKSGANVVVKHNTIDMTGVPASDQTAPIFDTGSQVPAMDVENNLLLGGSYTVRLYNDGPAGSGYVFKGNSVVDGSWLYGAVDSDCSVLAPWSPSDANGNQLVQASGDYAVTKVLGPLYCTNTR